MVAQRLASLRRTTLYVLIRSPELTLSVTSATIQPMSPLNPKSVYELHATILHLLGIDHEALTYPFNGRDMRLTDVDGNVIKEILA